MELPFAGLHQLCASLLRDLSGLPQPQQDALRVAFGLAAGAAPDRFLVGLAALTLLAEVAETQPLLCLVDDLQWLDEASAQVLAFVARRLLAERIAIVFAIREPSEQRQLAGLPELRLEGLDHEDASALLATVVAGRLDEHVRERIIAETRGNPLALLELPRGMNAAELAAGFGPPRPGVLEDNFQRRLDCLPADTRRLLQLAAADPVGEPLLVWRAAERLGIGPDAAAAAVDAGLFEIRAQVRFRHPAVRSAAYRSASPEERQAVHAALADATDARARPGPARLAPRPGDARPRRARRRGAGALGRPRPGARRHRRCRRVPRERGHAHARTRPAVHAACSPRRGRSTTRARSTRRWSCWSRSRPDPVDALQAAEIEELRGEIAFDQRRVGEATRLLSRAACRLDSLDTGRARTTHLRALGAAMWAGPELLREAAEAARAAPSGAAGAVDLLVDALATRVTDGYAAAAPVLRQALEAVLALEVDTDVGHWLWLTGSRGAAIAAMEVWDADAWHALVTRHVQIARDMGALVLLQFGLQSLVRTRVLAGDLAAAAQAIEEARAIAEATGTPPVVYTEPLLAAWRGQEALTRGADRARDDGAGRMAALRGVLDVGPLQRHRALRRRVGCGAPGLRAGLPRIRAVRGAGAGRGGVADRRDGAPGRRARADRRALSSDSRRLGARDAGARASAREQRRAVLPRVDRAPRPHAPACWRWPARSCSTASGCGARAGGSMRASSCGSRARSFLAAGADGFAERARHELLATGEKVRKRRDETRDELTPQEQHIARLARDGRTNPEIGAELFLSPRTVEWHLKKVFTKLGISSRRALSDALPREREVASA